MSFALLALIALLAPPQQRAATPPRGWNYIIYVCFVDLVSIAL